MCRLFSRKLQKSAHQTLRKCIPSKGICQVPCYLIQPPKSLGLNLLLCSELQRDLQMLCCHQITELKVPGLLLVQAGPGRTRSLQRKGKRKSSSSPDQTQGSGSGRDPGDVEAAKPITMAKTQTIWCRQPSQCHDGFQIGHQKAACKDAEPLHGRGRKLWQTSTNGGRITSSTAIQFAVSQCDWDFTLELHSVAEACYVDLALPKVHSGKS